MCIEVICIYKGKKWEDINILTYGNNTMMKALRQKNVLCANCPLSLPPTFFFAKNENSKKIFVCNILLNNMNFPFVSSREYETYNSLQDGKDLCTHGE